MTEKDSVFDSPYYGLTEMTKQDWETVYSKTTSFIRNSNFDLKEAVNKQKKKKFKTIKTKTEQKETGNRKRKQEIKEKTRNRKRKKKVLINPQRMVLDVFSHYIFDFQMEKFATSLFHHTQQ